MAQQYIMILGINIVNAYNRYVLYTLCIPPLNLVLHVSKYLMLVNSSFFLAVLDLYCCAWALSRCGRGRGRLLSIVGHGLTAVDSLAGERGFQGVWAPAVTALHSAAVAHGFSCPMARGTFPDQGSNTCPLHRQMDFHPPYHQGSPSDSSNTSMLSEAHTLVDLTGKTQCSEQCSVSSCVLKAFTCSM